MGPVLSLTPGLTRACAPACLRRVQGRFEILRPKRTSLRRRTGISDELMLDFLAQLLQVGDQA